MAMARVTLAMPPPIMASAGLSGGGIGVASISVGESK